jgi:hypothetical protein
MNARGKAARTAVAATVCLIAAALAGCSTPHDTPGPTLTLTPTKTVAPTPTLTATALPTVSPAVAEAEAAILEAYRGYWSAKISTLAKPDQTEPNELSYFAVDRALGDVRSTLDLYRLNGIANKGEPVLSPSVTGVVLDGASSTATVRDCVDVTNWSPVYVGDGSSAAAPGQNLRSPSETWAMIYDGHWVVSQSVTHRDTTC